MSILVMMLIMAFQAVLPKVAAQQQERVLTIAMGEPIDSANPFVGITDNAYIFFGLVYDYLMSPDEDLINRPNIAESWYYMDGPTAATTGSNFALLDHNQTPDDWPLGSIWQYNISHDIFWSDGVDLTADDVKWTMEIQTGANFNTYWAYQPYTRWMNYIEKVDEYTVRIFYADFDTEQPFPVAFGGNLYIPIMPRHAFEGKASSFLGQEWSGIPAIGSGAFRGSANLEAELIAKESVNMVRNDFYDFVDPADDERKGLGGKYNRTVEIDRLVMKFFSEESTLSLSVRTGDTDTGEIQAGTYLTWIDDPNLPAAVSTQVLLSPTAYSKQVVLNDYADAAGELNPLRLDPAVQRAVALATNKTHIKNAIYKELADPGYGLISPVWPEWYWEPDNSPSTFDVYNETGVSIYNYTKPQINVMDYDIVTANEILNAAGYVWQNSSGKTVRVAGDLAAKRMKAMFDTDPGSILGKELVFEQVVEQEVFEDRQVGDFLVSEWEKIGVWIQSGQGGHTISLVNSATWNLLIYSYTYNTMQTYWSGDIDPNYLTYVASSFSLWGWNEFGTTVEEYDNYYLNQARTFDYDERKYWVDKCSEWMYLSGSVITTVYPKICFAINNESWEGWGDWIAHPGMTMDAFWTENPLWWKLQYKEQEVQPFPVEALIAGIGVVAVIVAVTAVIMLRKKKKIQSMLEEEEEGEEDLEEEE
ncbi:MAG: ABC transporter substrate-binding protein [Thermoplasmata archaeon]|nr:ABC transporter substrate-binding protein [Thermoplasmata archaeon]